LVIQKSGNLLHNQDQGQETYRFIVIPEQYHKLRLALRVIATI